MNSFLDLTVRSISDLQVGIEKKSKTVAGRDKMYAINFAMLRDLYLII